MSELHRSRINVILFIVTLSFISFAVVGGVRGYSAVPFWDMWDGYLTNYVKLIDGDLSALWDQHNEHRLVLSRLFFWLDLTLFQGSVWFLVVLNYFLLSLICVVFLLAWREQSESNNYVFGFFLVAWLFWWIQNTNMTWGFQSQFFLAQLLPLIAFYLLHKSVSDKEYSLGYYFAATASGLLAIGSMANGLLALPLLMLFSLMIRNSWWRSALLGILSVSAFIVYFYAYNPPPHHSSLSEELLRNPVGLFQYVLIYIGGPFYYLFGKGAFGVMIALVSGVFMILASSIYAWKALRNPTQSTLQLAMLFFILFVGGTAFGTAGGRLKFGVMQALSSRYMTPALMAWAALFILSIPLIAKIKQKTVTTVICIMLLLMLPFQLKAFRSKQGELFEKNIAALAIELGIEDQVQISKIYPRAKAVVAKAEKPVKRNLSIFGSPAFKDLRERLGSRSSLSDVSRKECSGHMNEIHVINKDSRFVRIGGWIFDDSVEIPRETLTIYDSNGKVLGFVMLGQESADAVREFGKNAGRSGFKGYLLADAQGESAVITGKRLKCQLTVTVPRTLYKEYDMSMSSSEVTVMETSVLNGNEWLGSDSHKSHEPGLRVLGSYIYSDADVGSIMLMMKRGDKLFYRSGRNNGRQMVEVENTRSYPIQLPVASEWKLLEFTGEWLPDNFVLKLSDSGDDAGEWSAVALGKSKQLK